MPREATLQYEVQLVADDHSYFCLPPVEEGRVSVLARSPYLNLALAPEVMRGP